MFRWVQSTARAHPRVDAGSSVHWHKERADDKQAMKSIRHFSVCNRRLVRFIASSKRTFFLRRECRISVYCISRKRYHQLKSTMKHITTRITMSSKCQCALRTYPRRCQHCTYTHVMVLGCVGVMYIHSSRPAASPRTLLAAYTACQYLLQPTEQQWHIAIPYFHTE